MVDHTKDDSPFLDRDAETVRWETVLTPEEAEQLREQINEHEPVTWLEASDAEQLEHNHVLEEQNGQTSIVLLLRAFGDQEKEKFLAKLDPLLSRLWSNSKQLHIVTLVHS